MMDIRISKYGEEQIIGFLRQVQAGIPIKEIGRKHGFSDASFYESHSKFGDIDASEAKWLQELELESSKLKHLPRYPFKGVSCCRCLSLPVLFFGYAAHHLPAVHVPCCASYGL